MSVNLASWSRVLRKFWTLSKQSLSRIGLRKLRRKSKIKSYSIPHSLVTRSRRSARRIFLEKCRTRSWSTNTLRRLRTSSRLRRNGTFKRIKASGRRLEEVRICRDGRLGGDVRRQTGGHGHQVGVCIEEGRITRECLRSCLIELSSVPWQDYELVTLAVHRDGRPTSAFTTTHKESCLRAFLYCLQLYSISIGRSVRRK